MITDNEKRLIDTINNLTGFIYKLENELNEKELELKFYKEYFNRKTGGIN